MSYHDSDAKNEGGLYREDDGVDIVKAGEGLAIGYTQTGEWLEFTVDVKTAGDYLFRANVASGLEGSGFKLYMDGKAVTDAVEVPKGADWDTYGTVDGKIGAVTAGKHVLKVEITGAYVNIDWIRFGLDEASLPIHNRVEMNVSEPQDFYVFNAKGKMLTKMNAVDLNGVREQMQAMGMQPGAYIIRSANGAVKQVMKLTR